MTPATTEQWFATIEGAPHLSTTFRMAAGATPGQARMRAWEIWSHARAYGSTSDAPIAAQGLVVRLVAADRELAA